MFGFVECCEDIEFNLEVELNKFMNWGESKIVFVVDVCWRYMKFVIDLLSLWFGNFRDFLVFVICMVILLLCGCIILGIVDEEIVWFRF